MAKVLVVDDSLFMRGALRKILDKGGHQLAGEAGNGNEAVALYVQNRPDVVLMDVVMPDLDGVGAVRKIIEKDPKARILMTSPLAERTLVMEGLQAGARDFVTKPFQEAEVLKAIQKLVG